MTTRLRLHLVTALLALLGILPGSLSQTNSASQNPYDEKAAIFQRSFAVSNAPAQAVVLARVYALRNYVNDASRLTSWFEQVARESAEPVIKNEAERYIAAMKRGSEKPLPAEELLKMAQQAVQAQPDSADALDTLGQLEQLRGIADAYDRFEQATRLAPTGERWLRVAKECANSICQFAALNAAQQASPNNTDVLECLAEYYSGRGQSQKARTLLEKAVAMSPADFTLRVQLADLNLAAGKNAAAIDDLRMVEQQFPNVTWVAEQVASRYETLGLVERALALNVATLSHDFRNTHAREALARIYAKRHDAEKLRALYADALKSDPSDEWAAAGLKKLDGNARPAASESARESREGADPDGTYLLDAAKLAAAAHRAAPAERAAAVELADVRVERVAENGLSTVRVQQVAYISSEQGVRDYATRTVTYASSAQKLQVLRARVFKADGQVMDAEDAGESGPGETAASIYYDTRTRTLRYPTLEKGDVVELDYQLLPDSKTNPYGNYFGELVTFGSSLPRKLQRYVLIAPAARPLYISQARLTKAVESTEGGQRAYAWEMRDLPPLPSEPRGPATTEVAPYVHVSTFASWNDVGRWYADLIAPQFKLDATLRDVLAKLVIGKTTDEEKIKAIHQFVLRNTHYVALEFGIFSYKPYPVQQVYARRFGDCKDKASLMIALLRASAIDADMALVRTRRLGDIADDATSISIFNHAVVYIPKYDLWLDGTAEYAGSHELPLDDQGAQALTVSLDGSAQLRRIPVTLPMENYTHRQVRAQLQADGRIQFTGSAYTRGEDAPGLRREYEIAERQRTSFRNRLAEVLPAVRLDSVEVNGAHDLESDVIVNFSGDLDTNVGKRIVALTPSWMTRSYVQTLAPLTSRVQDLILPAPWTTEEELHFVLPAGSRIESLPQDTNLETAFGMATVRYQRQGNEVVVKTSVQFRKLRISAAEYSSFRDFCSQVEGAFRNEIKVGL